MLPHQREQGDVWEAKVRTHATDATWERTLRREYSGKSNRQRTLSLVVN